MTLVKTLFNGLGLRNKINELYFTRGIGPKCIYLHSCACCIVVYKCVHVLHDIFKKKHEQNKNKNPKENKKKKAKF